MNSNLVVPNFSRTSNNALEYIAALAQLLKYKTDTFNAFKLPIHASNTLLSKSSMEALIEKSKEKLRKQASKLSGKFNIEVEFKNQYAVFDIIDQIASKNLFRNEPIEFVLGLKPFSEIMLKNRKHKVFNEFTSQFT